MVQIAGRPHVRRLREFFHTEDPAACGEAAAVIQRSETGRSVLRYRALVQRSREIAGALAREGVAAGTPVAIFALNSIDWVLCRFALVAADAPCVPIDYDADAARVARLLDDSGARWL